jgi:glutamyl/glutaminyl-tRNA synthetase
MSLDELFDKVSDFWPEEAKAYDNDYKIRVLSLIQERLKFFAELPDLSRSFFVDLPIDPTLIENHKQLSKFTSNELKSMLQTSRDSLSESDFSTIDISQRLNALLVQTQQKPVVLFSLIRIATTQAPSSPGLSDTLTVLGKGRALNRLDAQINDL